MDGFARECGGPKTLRGICYCHTIFVAVGLILPVAYAQHQDAEPQEILGSCSLKNSENPRSVPIMDVPIARSEKASTMYETPLQLMLDQGESKELDLVLISLTSPSSSNKKLRRNSYSPPEERQLLDRLYLVIGVKFDMKCSK